MSTGGFCTCVVYTSFSADTHTSSFIPPPVSSPTGTTPHAAVSSLHLAAASQQQRMPSGFSFSQVSAPSSSGDTMMMITEAAGMSGCSPALSSSQVPSSPISPASPLAAVCAAGAPLSDTRAAHSFNYHDHHQITQSQPQQQTTLISRVTMPSGTNEQVCVCFCFFFVYSLLVALTVFFLRSICCSFCLVCCFVLFLFAFPVLIALYLFFIVCMLFSLVVSFSFFMQSSSLFMLRSHSFTPQDLLLAQQPQGNPSRSHSFTHDDLHIVPSPLSPLQLRQQPQKQQQPQQQPDLQQQQQQQSRYILDAQLEQMEPQQQQLSHYSQPQSQLTSEPAGMFAESAAENPLLPSPPSSLLQQRFSSLPATTIPMTTSSDIAASSSSSLLSSLTLPTIPVSPAVSPVRPHEVHSQHVHELPLPPSTTTAAPSSSCMTAALEAESDDLLAVSPILNENSAWSSASPGLSLPFCRAVCVAVSQCRNVAMLFNFLTSVNCVFVFLFAPFSRGFSLLLFGLFLSRFVPMILHQLRARRRRWR